MLEQSTVGCSSDAPSDVAHAASSKSVLLLFLLPVYAELLEWILDLLVHFKLWQNQQELLVWQLRRAATACGRQRLGPTYPDSQTGKRGRPRLLLL